MPAGRRQGATATGVRRRVQLTCRPDFPFQLLAGQSVIFAVRARALCRPHHPAQEAVVREGQVRPSGESGGHLVDRRRFNALGLPLPVGGPEGIRQLGGVVAGRPHRQFEALTQGFGDGPAEFLGQVVNVLGDGRVRGRRAAQLARQLGARLRRLLQQGPSRVGEVVGVLVYVREDVRRGGRPFQTAQPVQERVLLVL